MRIRNLLTYNNKGYGKGKAYIAKITGYDEKFRFKREFVYRNIEELGSFKYWNKRLKTVWYDYSWDIKDEGIYEWVEENGFKSSKIYFVYNKEIDNYEQISINKVNEMFPKPQ